MIALTSKPFQFFSCPSQSESEEESEDESEPESESEEESEDESVTCLVRGAGVDEEAWDDEEAGVVRGGTVAGLS